MTEVKTLWNDEFKIKFTLANEETVTEIFKGSLRSAIRYALNRYDQGVASFYTSDGKWLKEIGW